MGRRGDWIRGIEEQPTGTVESAGRGRRRRETKRCWPLRALGQQYCNVFP